MIGRFLRWFVGDAPDPALKLQTWTRPDPANPEQAYDYAKAKAGAARARRQSETGRPLPKPRRVAAEAAKGATVEPFRRRG